MCAGCGQGPGRKQELEPPGWPSGASILCGQSSSAHMCQPETRNAGLKWQCGCVGLYNQVGEVRQASGRLQSTAPGLGLERYAKAGAAVLGEMGHLL